MNTIFFSLFISIIRILRKFVCVLGKRLLYDTMILYDTPFSVYDTIFDDTILDDTLVNDTILHDILPYDMVLYDICAQMIIEFSTKVSIYTTRLFSVFIDVHTTAIINLSVSRRVSNRSMCQGWELSVQVCL